MCNLFMEEVPEKRANQIIQMGELGAWRYCGLLWNIYCNYVFRQRLSRQIRNILAGNTGFLLNSESGRMND